MNIEIKLKSLTENPTEFEKGDVIKFIQNELDTAFLVVGENDLFLHTFCLQGGAYIGINKNPHADNLKAIEKI